MATALPESESSSSSSSEEFDFEEQIRLEKLERERVAAKAAVGEQVQTYTDQDGAVFEWNADLKAWFPKVDEDFIASYQMNYGVAYDYDKMPVPKPMPTVQPEVEEGVAEKPQQAGEKKKRKRKKDKDLAAMAAQSSNAAWFEVAEDKNTSVYVSNLPSDFTEEEFLELMQKCGLVLYDPFNKKPKIKLYRNADGTLKGDGRCCYIKVESVGLALQILDGWSLRENKTLHVERAKFQPKGEQFDPSKRKRKLTNKEKKAIKERQEKLFDWRPEKLEIQRGRHERVAILKHMFTPEELDADPDLFNDLNDDIKEEAAKAGPVKRIVICDRNSDGVAMIHFKAPEDADKCIAAMNGRFYNTRKLEAFTWDGKTKYHIEETEEERAKRLEKWYHFLEQDNRDKETPSEVDAASTKANPPSVDRSAASTPSDTTVDTTASIAGSDAPTPVSVDSIESTGNEAGETAPNNGRRRAAYNFRNATGDLSDNSDDDAAFNSTDEEEQDDNA